MTAKTLFGELCLRADARPETGVGHLMRCLALAQAWQDRGGNAVFVTASETPALLARLDREGCEVHRLQAAPASTADAAETVAVAAQRAAAWIVADGYAFSPDYLQSLRRENGQLLVIDDLAAQDLTAAQLIVNPNLQPPLASLAGGQLAPILPPNDGFFEPVTFIGAVPPAPAPNWMNGWTSFPQN